MVLHAADAPVSDAAWASLASRKRGWPSASAEGREAVCGARASAAAVVIGGVVGNVARPA
jgi:hypothetical protein